MPDVSYYLGRPARLWIAVMSGAANDAARTQCPGNHGWKHWSLGSAGKWLAHVPSCLLALNVMCLRALSRARLVRRGGLQVIASFLVHPARRRQRHVTLNPSAADSCVAVLQHVRRALAAIDYATRADSNG